MLMTLVQVIGVPNASAKVSVMVRVANAEGTVEYSLSGNNKFFLHVDWEIIYILIT